MIYFQTFFSKMFEAFRNAVVPFSCHLCGSKSGWRRVICTNCETRLAGLIQAPKEVRDVLFSFPIFTLGIYEEPLSTAIRTIKYRPSPRLWECLDPFVHKVLTISRYRPEVVIPVPLHQERENKRGFNQAALIGRCVANACGAAFSPAIKRSRFTRPQAECSEEERRDNLKGAFSLAEDLCPESFRGRHITLVDDVATTGSTLAGCALVLKELKPASIQALVLAHSYLRRQTDR
ncbi:MAG: ComF family protein [Candidatus Riflebacteria bacterium]|nr:ComF family protein [Candidatus Riflebacteria bacterium]